jgi:hypothetical protein
MKQLKLIAAAATAMLLASCGSGQSPSAPSPTPLPTPTPPPARDAILLGSITPAPGTLHRPGQTATFTATLNYTLVSASSGQIVMVIQDQRDQSLVEGRPQAAVAVSGGTGSVTLTDSVAVPSSGVSSVRVILPLFPEGATSTTTVVSVTFPVG